MALSIHVHDDRHIFFPVLFHTSFSPPVDSPVNKISTVLLGNLMGVKGGGVTPPAPIPFYNTSARIYRPSFRQNWVYKFGHRLLNKNLKTT
jgi:hypothetical protein